MTHSSRRPLRSSRVDAGPGPGTHRGAAKLRSSLAALEHTLDTRFRLARVRIPLGDDSMEIIRPENSDDLINEADFVKDERMPYWADIWPSAVALASHVATLDGRGRRLLELGCGAGLVSAAALKSGFVVTATDYYEDALLFARVNALRNGGFDPRVLLLDWRQIPDDLETFDLVVASDVLYEQTYPALVAGVLARALSADGAALIADPGRLAAPEFPGECEKHGLVVSDRSRVPFDEGDVHQVIEILTVRRS